MRHRCSSDRGASLVDLVIGLALTALMAGVIAGLMTATASRAPAQVTETDFGLIADQFARDVREADSVVYERRGRNESVTLSHDLEEVVWSIERLGLTRTPGSGTTRTMVVDVDRSASTFTLIAADGSTVDPDDPDAVRWCTRLVGMEIVATDGGLDRQAALRVSPTAERCP